jgi:hypothetical protein
VNAANPGRLVTIGARVPPDLAEAVAALAQRADRTVSREVFRAIRAHVQSSTVGSGSSVDFRAESAMGRGSSVDDPVERDGTSRKSEAVEPAQLAGEPEREEKEHVGESDRSASRA